MQAYEFKIRPGTAAFEKGQKRIIEILETARDILLDGGYPALSMRKIATRMGISVGNLNYYYASKDALLEDLIDHIMRSYHEEIDAAKAGAGNSPVDQLGAIIRSVAEDCGDKTTGIIFPEMWALASHDPHAARSVEALYRESQEIYTELIPEINPRLSPLNCKRLAIYLIASIEGLVPLVGHNRAFSDEIPSVVNIAVASLVNTVQTISNDEIEQGLAATSS